MREERAALRIKDNYPIVLKEILSAINTCSCLKDKKVRLETRKIEEDKFRQKVAETEKISPITAGEKRFVFDTSIGGAFAVVAVVRKNNNNPQKYLVKVLYWIK